MLFRFCFTDFLLFAGFWSALQRLSAILDNHHVQCFNCSPPPYSLFISISALKVYNAKQNYNAIDEKLFLSYERTKVSVSAM